MESISRTLQHAIEGPAQVCLMKITSLFSCLVSFASIPKEIIPVYLFHATFGVLIFLLSLLFPRLKILVCLVELHLDAAPGQ